MRDTVETHLSSCMDNVTHGTEVCSESVWRTRKYPWVQESLHNVAVSRVCVYERQLCVYLLQSAVSDHTKLWSSDVVFVLSIEPARVLSAPA